ncbi:MAG: SDR family NAD(P)-dependent oxidoreductase [Anaerolineae bacterium]|nr:SDR family NAD(P)-dependent oxidoreductase [Anaerolineae bacterium]
MHYLVTGGAGFIGVNYAQRLLRRGEQVTLYDNLSRRGAASNAEWLRAEFGSQAFTLIHADVRDAERIKEAARTADAILHLAAQVAVTTSVADPREDFEINALGTFNMLEAARASQKRPIVLYASTNKVYGGMDDVGIEERETRYAYRDYPYGIPETYPLDFHSPYGCSKGTGDQYVRDYARIYDLPTVVFRQSCIYGPRQFGIEDQGWIAWFFIAALTGKAITIYGDGKQVRDVLYVTDLLDAYDAAIAHIDHAAGQVYNIGGGAANQLAVWKEFYPMLTNLIGREIPTGHSDWRAGDQRIYVSDIRKVIHDLQWEPQVTVAEGVPMLYRWISENLTLFQK